MKTNMGNGSDNIRKLAVVFPGIGYHVDKPLLYYAKKLARQKGYEIKDVPYGRFPDDVKGNADKMKEAFLSALNQSAEILSDVEWSSYHEIVFIGKSVGTVVACCYAGSLMKLGSISGVRLLLYTPVEQTFEMLKEAGLAGKTTDARECCSRDGLIQVFHGTNDPWVATDIVLNECAGMGLPLATYDNANHSLETGDVRTDLENLMEIMDMTDRFL